MRHPILRDCVEYTVVNVIDRSSNREVRVTYNTVTTGAIVSKYWINLSCEQRRRRTARLEEETALGISRRGPTRKILPIELEKSRHVRAQTGPENVVCSFRMRHDFLVAYSGLHRSNRILEVNHVRERWRTEWQCDVTRTTRASEDVTIELVIVRRRIGAIPVGDDCVLQLRSCRRRIDHIDHLDYRSALTTVSSSYFPDNIPIQVLESRLLRGFCFARREVVEMQIKRQEV